MNEWSKGKSARRRRGGGCVQWIGVLAMLCLSGADGSSFGSVTRHSFYWRQERVEVDAKPHDPHGAPTSVVPELVPVEVTSLGGNQRVALDAEVENTTDNELDVAVAIEILRDNGEVQGGRKVSLLRRLSPSHRGTSSAPGISSDLGDGYYCVRLTAAWTNNDDEGTTAAYLYIQVAQGRVDILSDSEWIERSAHNVGRAG